MTDPSDITVEASPREVVLAPGESTTLDVTVTRNPRYEQGVNLAILLQHLGGIHGNPLPPGVTVKEAGGKTLLGPKETKGKIILEAGPARPGLRQSPDRRHGARLDQLRGQDRLRQRADPGHRPSQGGCCAAVSRPLVHAPAGAVSLAIAKPRFSTISKIRTRFIVWKISRM